MIEVFKPSETRREEFRMRGVEKGSEKIGEWLFGRVWNKSQRRRMNLRALAGYSFLKIKKITGKNCAKETDGFQRRRQTSDVEVVELWRNGQRRGGRAAFYIQIRSFLFRPRSPQWSDEGGDFVMVHLVLFSRPGGFWLLGNGSLTDGRRFLTSIPMPTHTNSHATLAHPREDWGPTIPAYGQLNLRGTFLPAKTT